MKTTSFMQMSELAKGCVQSQPLTKPSTVSTTQGDTGADQLQAIKEYVLQYYGPAVRREGLCQITSIGRSKSFDLEKSDSTFPVGFPLYDGENSPKCFWTHEVIDWLISRCNNFRNKCEGV